MSNISRLLVALLVFSQTMGCAILVHQESPALSVLPVQCDQYARTSSLLPNSTRTVPFSQSHQNVVCAEEILLDATTAEAQTTRAEVRRQRDQIFAQAEKQAKRYLAQQQQTAMGQAEPQLRPQLQSDPIVNSAIRVASSRELEVQHSTSPPHSQINFAESSGQAHRPILLLTVVMLVLSGVTWPLARKHKRVAEKKEVATPAESLATPMTVVLCVMSQQVPRSPIPLIIYLETDLHPLCEMRVVCQPIDPVPVQDNAQLCIQAPIRSLIQLPYQLASNTESLLPAQIALPSPATNANQLIANAATHLPIQLAAQISILKSIRPVVDGELIEYRIEGHPLSHASLVAQNCLLSLIRLLDSREPTGDLMVRRTIGMRKLRSEEHHSRQLPIHTDRNVRCLKPVVGYVLLLNESEGKCSIAQVVTIESYTADHEGRFTAIVGQRIELS